MREHSAWPSRSTFHVNWPLLAFDLIVADWKIANAESRDESAFIASDLLDPPPVEHDWRGLYAAELASFPLIAEDLMQGGHVDGVELVLERAQLTIRERIVVRAYLAGDDVLTIAADLKWKPQATYTLLRNGLERLRQVQQWARPPAQDGERVPRPRHVPMQQTETMAALRLGA